MEIIIGIIIGFVIGCICTYMLMQYLIRYSIEHPEIIDSIIDRQLSYLNKQVENAIETKKNIFVDNTYENSISHNSKWI